MVRLVVRVHTLLLLAWDKCVQGQDQAGTRDCLDPRPVILRRHSCCEPGGHNFEGGALSQGGVLSSAVRVSESPRLKPPHVDDTLRLSPVRPVLPGPGATAPPVFVDATGRRAYRLRRWRWVVVVPAAAYLVAVASSLLGGPSLPSALLLVDRPGHGSTPQDHDAMRPEADLGSAPAASAELLAGSVVRGGETTDAASGGVASPHPHGKGSSGRSMSRGNSSETPAADRRLVRGQPSQPVRGNAEKANSGRGSDGQANGHDPDRVGTGRPQGSEALGSRQARAADSG